MATAAAAIIVKARQEVMSHFMQANAVSAEGAVPYAPDRRIRRRQFERLRDLGVIRTAGDDRYWIDAPRYDDWMRGQRRRALIAVAVLMVTTAVLALLAR